MWGNWIKGVWDTKKDWQPAIDECQCNSAPLPCYGPWPFGSGYTYSESSQFPCKMEADVSFPGWAYLELVFLVIVAIIAGSCFLCCTGRSRLLLEPFLAARGLPVVASPVPALTPRAPLSARSSADFLLAPSSPSPPPSPRSPLPSAPAPQTAPATFHSSPLPSRTRP